MASILRTLQCVEPKTRHYIRYYRISEIYEVRSNCFETLFIYISKINAFENIFFTYSYSKFNILIHTFDFTIYHL